MKHTFSNLLRVFLLTGISAVVVVMAGCSDSASTSSDIVDGVYKPDSKPFGKTYAEWSVSWWQWAYGTPGMDSSGNVIHPLLDTTGANAMQGQDGSSSVIFLGGVLAQSGVFTRSVTIPSGKAIFIPVVNGETDTVGVPQWTVDSLRNVLQGFMSGITGYSADIDGKAVANIASYKTAAGPFTYTLPQRNIYGVFGMQVSPGTVSPVLGDGYYLMIAPLSKGTHTLHVKGVGTTFSQEMTYTLTVQ